MDDFNFKAGELLKEFLPYELAVKLNELGFDEKCLASFYSGKKLFISNSRNLGFFTRTISAPLWQQAFDWFREKHGLYISIRKVIGNEGTISEVTSWTCTGSPWDSLPTYEQARISCLEKLIEALKK